MSPARAKSAARAIPMPSPTRWVLNSDAAEAMMTMAPVATR